MQRESDEPQANEGRGRCPSDEVESRANDRGQSGTARLESKGARCNRACNRTATSGRHDASDRRQAAVARFARHAGREGEVPMSMRVRSTPRRAILAAAAVVTLAVFGFLGARPLSAEAAPGGTDGDVVLG